MIYHALVYKKPKRARLVKIIQTNTTMKIMDVLSIILSYLSILEKKSITFSTMLFPAEDSIGAATVSEISFWGAPM